MAEKRRSLLVDERLGETEWGRMIRSQVTVNQYDQGESIRYEKETFTRWINASLAAAPPPLRNDVVVGDLFLDLRDGLVLYYLVALLSNRASAAVGRPHAPRRARGAGPGGRAAAWNSTTGPHQTSELSSSVTSTSIRPIFGRVVCSRRVLEARPKSLRRNCRIH